MFVGASDVSMHIMMFAEMWVYDYRFPVSVAVNGAHVIPIE